MFSYRPNLFIPEKVVVSWSKNTDLYILRTDLLHPVVSGNKWFKLKYYIKDALEKGFKQMITFGGCFSNHIIATAFAAHEAGLKATGIIRGEEGAQFNSHTLQQAKNYGMHFHFVSREDFKNKNELKEIYSGHYIVNEGGYGVLGAKGAGEMLTNVDGFEEFDYIVLAVGTGTTMAGIINAAHTHQKIMGISVMKNNYSLQSEMISLLEKSSLNKKFELLQDFHFGEYAKKNDELLSFMNNLYEETNTPTDFVYTGKAAYALKQMIDNNIIEDKAKILFVHTGGLQGNCTLPKDKLRYQ